MLCLYDQTTIEIEIDGKKNSPRNRSRLLIQAADEAGHLYSVFLLS